MKILALHGLGSSYSLLKEQLRPFIKELGTSCQFVFLDGATTVEEDLVRDPATFTVTPILLSFASTAVRLWANMPFYSYATGFTTLEVREAFDRIDKFIKGNDPSMVSWVSASEPPWP